MKFDFEDKISKEGKMIVSRECCFVVHVPRTDSTRDVHAVIRKIYHEDGTSYKEIKYMTDMARPYWITKPMERKHKFKKEFELMTHLDIHWAIQSDLPKEIAKKINYQFKNPDFPNIREVANSPYVYGIDATTESLIKASYAKAFPDQGVSRFAVCAFDIEADIDTGEITVISASMEDKIYVTVNPTLIQSLTGDMTDRIKELWLESIPKDIKQKEIEIEVLVCKDELDCILKMFNYLHKKSPDFLAIWNMSYDIQHIVRRLETFGVDPASVFSDPSAIDRYCMYFKYMSDAAQKVTASGRVTNKSVEERWDHVITPASFYIIDAMQAFYRMRLGQPKFHGGYSLDNVIEKILGEDYKKLKFKHLGDIEYMVGIDWHKAMSKHHPLEYIVYNMWDTYAMILLDNKTTDLCIGVPCTYNGTSFRIINQQPKMLVDKIHQFYLKEGKVMSCKGSEVIDYMTLGLEDWIVTVEPFKVRPNVGLKALSDAPDTSTNIRHLVCDNDQEAGYPSDTIASNASIDTLCSELLDVEGIHRIDFLRQNINYLFGSSQMLEYSQVLCDAPSIKELLTGELEEKREKAPSRAQEFTEKIAEIEQKKLRRY